MTVLPSTAEWVTHWLGKMCSVIPAEQMVFCFFFSFSKLWERIPSFHRSGHPQKSHGQHMRRILANQSPRQQLVTAQALYVGEIMKHLISKTKGNVQKDWWKMEGNCFLLHPTRKHKPFPNWVGFFFGCPFCFCLKFNISDHCCILKGIYIYDINIMILTKRYMIWT